MMARMWTVILMGLIALSMASSCFALAVGEAAPAFKLSDQFGKSWDVSALRGSVVVVVAANRDSGRAMGPWFQYLKSKYGSRIQLLGLMQLSGIPGFARGIARNRIKKETSDPLMLDFNGATGKLYEVSGKHPVVVVIDKTGVVRAVERINYTVPVGKSVSDAIDVALK